MNRTISKKLSVFVWIFVCFMALFACGRLEATNSAAVKEEFSDPPRQYHSAPLWVWNDMLTDEEIVGTLRDLAGQQVKQAFVHPRPGLMTPYLSPEWFRLWKVALKEAERLDMNIWIYDENSYPSGFAGGLVPEAMPESRGKGLYLDEVKTAPGPGDKIVAVFQIIGNTYENITEKIRKGQTFDDGRYLVASIRLAPTGGWFGGKYYVDLIKPGVTEKFIEVTMEKYRQNIGEQFAKRVPGWFTDEPHLAPAGGLHWSDNLPQLFQERWGYSLIDHLPQLARPVGDWKRVRHNYYCLLLEQFIDRWAKPCYEYCEKYNLEFTGHYWEHGWPDAGHGGDNMAMYAWHQRPAIDTLMNQYSEDVHAQFGNVRSVKELSSVANQLGKKRTLCETYGAGGWDLRFEDMKRIGDWLYVLGVNTLDEHLSYITIRGARKRDHPQSFSYHEPWWKAYHVMAEYFARLSLIMSQGQQVNRILVIEPTTTAWMYQGDTIPRKKLNDIGNQFQQMVVSLAKAQVEYDIGCEDIIARHGSTEGRLFRIGQRDYSMVVLPPLTENLNRRTMELLSGYAQAGGAVICCGQPLSYMNGQQSKHGVETAKHSGWKQVEPADVPQMLLNASTDGFSIERDADDKGILFHHRRTLDDGEFLLLVNTSIEEPSAGLVKSAAGSIEQWDPATAKISMYPFENTGAGVKARFELPPCGSLVLFLSEKIHAPVAETKTTARTIASDGELDIRPIEDNVLTIDYVDITAGGETKKNFYFYKASQFAFSQNGMERNPWDSAVQFRDELISRTFSPNSGFKATYRFTIEQRIPERLYIVIERPDLYSIRCNGKTVSAMKDTWWLDKAFGKIDISDAARIGDNIVTITASPFTVYHELESAYVLGAFKLKESSSGFVIAGASGPGLELGSWKKQGYPFYAAGVDYKQKFNVNHPDGRYLVELDKWYGSVVEVIVNGGSSGYIAYKPWQYDVTDLIKQGTNTIEVVVIGTLKNTLGPHHAGTGFGSAWPGMFQQGPETGPPAGKDYHTVDYGLFELFVLKQIIEK
jgi:hypothetical protein